MDEEPKEIKFYDYINNVRRIAKMQWELLIDSKNTDIAKKHMEGPEYDLDIYIAFMNGTAMDLIAAAKKISYRDVDVAIRYWLEISDKAIVDIRRKEYEEKKRQASIEGDRQYSLEKKKYESELKVRQEFEEIRLEKSRWARLRQQETKRIEAMSKHLDKLDAIISNLGVCPQEKSK